MDSSVPSNLNNDTTFNSNLLNNEIFSQKDVIEYLKRKGLSVDSIQRLQVYNNNQSLQNQENVNVNNININHTNNIDNKQRSNKQQSKSPKVCFVNASNQNPSHHTKYALHFIFSLN